MYRLIALVVLAAATIALDFSPAQAATTIGDDLASAPTIGGAGFSGFYMTSINRASGDAESGSPINGVLTSVSIRTNGNGGQYWVRNLRLTNAAPPGYTFLNVGPDIGIWATGDSDPSGHVTTVSTRQTILVGDRLGLVYPQSVFHDFAAYAAGPAICASFPSLLSPAHDVGTTATLNTSDCGFYQPLVKGTVEADADSDGYGDETQDACANDNARHDLPCTAEVGVYFGSVRWVGRKKTRKRVSYEIRNMGPAAASNVVLGVTKPYFAAKVSAVGCTLSADRSTCALGSIPAGDKRDVSLTVLSKRGRPGWSRRRNLSLRLVGLDQTDPSSVNNDWIYGFKLKFRRR